MGSKLPSLLPKAIVVTSQIPLYVLFKEGAGSRARTDDLLITNHGVFSMEFRSTE